MLKRVGRSSDAIRDFRKAAELNPRNTDAVREVRLFNIRAGSTPMGPRGGDDKPGMLGKLFGRKKK